MFRLDGKLALITGAGQNIGAGIARLMAAQDATVMVNHYHRDRGERTVAESVAPGGVAHAVPFD
jgi:NAD(P)-dependent dehydrogenase (short-subunit alcohol dehydrogenase family)